MVLGLPWLCKHRFIDHQLAHRPHKILVTTMRHNLPIPLLTVTQHGGREPAQILREYRKLAKVFSATKAASLPQHCAINLLPGTPPRTRVYPLSLTETKVMEDYYTLDITCLSGGSGPVPIIVGSIRSR